jgi:NRAMP (natural resistance-associated macrophage protein)-like metal ion transporter
MGLGLITGAADDDPSAIGTYASAGAKIGPSFLWTAPTLFPMMFAVVYLSGKLGQVTGQGLFQVLREHFPRWVLYPVLIGALVSNTIEAAADLGGMAAAANLLVPVPIPWLVVAIAVAILSLQTFASYVTIRNIFRWFALALLAYVGSAFLVKPELAVVLRGTFVPTLDFSSEALSMLVAVIGSTLSAYLYTWQSNEEVEEKIATGRVDQTNRRGASPEEIRAARTDILSGMFFSSVVMYFIMLSTATTLHQVGNVNISTAAEAAQALRPIAGDAAEVLFATGVVAVGFIAVPVMTIGAAYDLAQTLGWRWG